MLLALAAGAAELWRWKDADGVVHYSDRPVQGAERIEVLSKQKTSPDTPPAPSYTPPPPPTDTAYTRCIVTLPANEQVFNGVSSVDMSIFIEPALRAGHRSQVLLNGRPDTDWPSGTSSRTLANAYRGTYTLSVRVLDAGGRALCEGPAITFHVRQPSLLAPGRRPPAAKP